MKRIICVLVSLVLAAGLCSCALTEESSDPALTLSMLAEEETVMVHLYSDKGEETLEVEVTDEFLSLMDGKWEKASGQGGADKVLTVTVGTQHEITYFEGGAAMIYYGFASVFEKDRCYYSVELEGELSKLYDYCAENGTVPETEE